MVFSSISKKHKVPLYQVVLLLAFLLIQKKKKKTKKQKRKARTSQNYNCFSPQLFDNLIVTNGGGFEP